MQLNLFPLRHGLYKWSDRREGYKSLENAEEWSYDIADVARVGHQGVHHVLDDCKSILSYPAQAGWQAIARTPAALLSQNGGHGNQEENNDWKETDLDCVRWTFAWLKSYR